MRILREAGFFSNDEIRAASGTVRPRDVTESLLFDAWTFDEGEPDLTVMRIVVEGEHQGVKVRHTFDLLDYYDTESETSSMARTTGYPAAIITGMLARGEVDARGALPQERCIPADRFRAALATRGITIHRSETTLP